MATVVEHTDRRHSEIEIWLPAAIFPVAAAMLGLGLPGWVFLWVLALGIYASLKWLTFMHALSSGRMVAWRRAAGYLLLWPGMDAESFLFGGRPERRARWHEWLFAVAKTALGVVLFTTVAGRLYAVEPGGDWLAAWSVMAGVVFVLHFGLIHLLALAWQAVGVRADPIMRTPILARSLTDFWGRRWNLAFRDFAHTFLFRPLQPRYGGAAATMAVFLFSGVVHDLVISLSAGGGYGWPTLYFLTQGTALLFERSRIGRRLGLGRGWRGRLFTAVVILAPIGWLFHLRFLDHVVLPMWVALTG